MSEGGQEEIRIYECVKCLAIIPYIGCPHNCTGDDNSSDEEGFGEDIAGWLEEIKGKMCTVVQAPDPVIYELLPNQPDQQYPEDLIHDGEDRPGYHIRQEGEEVPDGVIPTDQTDPN